MPARFRNPTRTSTFRRIAASMWRQPSDPSIHGLVDIDVTETLAFLDHIRATTGRKLTMTHIVARAVAHAFQENPHLNAKVRFGGRIEERETVDLFISVSTDGGRDLAGARIEAADQLDLPELHDALAAEVDRTRKGKDQQEKGRKSMAMLPWWCLRPMLGLIDFLTNELHVHLPALGLLRDPFGTAVITNVGMFGIDTAFAPFLPLGRTPMLLLVTEVKKRPTVVDDQVVARPTLRLCATFDHRIIDGSAAGVLARAITDAVAHPASFYTAQRAA